MPLPQLHFVHGNSFPSGTYNEMLAPLRAFYRIKALPQHAHNPAYPVTDGWPHLVEELIAELETYQKPVILVGHSMGGMLGLMASHARPELVRCLVLVDAPVVAGWRAQAWRMAKIWRQADVHSPSRYSKKRRNVWADAEDAFRHFVAKPMFAIWPEQVLRDYLEHGLKPHAEGVTLKFEREIETEVYRTLPHHIGSLAAKPFPVPVGFIAGADSVECRRAGLEASRALVGEHFVTLPGGHLFPMEAPQAAAAAVHGMIQSLLAEKRAGVK